MSHNVILPPGFELITLRERANAHEEAVRQIERGAGTLFWARRYEVAEFALILEPEEPIESAIRAFYLGMNALADTLSTHAPPDKSVTINFPDALLLDNGLIGGGRIEIVGDCLVFSGMIRTSIVGILETGTVAGATSLEDEGGEMLDAGEIIASFSRHFMANLHDYLTDGMKKPAQTYLARLPKSADRRGIAVNGDLLEGKITHSLLEALKPMNWFDRTQGAPKL
jgi:hypothetical protein